MWPFCGCEAAVIKTDKFEVIQDILEMADEHTLVVFDIKDVLLKANDQILQHHNKDYRKKLSKNMSDEVYSVTLLQRELISVDDRFVGLIGRLQEKGVKVMALTSCLTGKFGKIDALEDIRMRDIKQAGYHFEKSWENTPPKNLGYLSQKKPDHLTLFKEGIIFASRAPKGDALKAFLKGEKHDFKKVIFVDNKKKNIVYIQNAAYQLGIELVAIHYTAVENSPKEPLDEALAQFQFDMLKKEERWLRDKEAMKALKSIAQSTVPLDPQ